MRRNVSKEINKFLRDPQKPIPEPSAPYYPQANGLAESAVKQVKHLLEKYDRNWDAFEDNLLEWRDTPNDSGSTPNELFFGRRVRTSLPILPGKTNFDIKNAVASGVRRKKRREKAYTERRTHDLPPLDPGQTVSIQNPKGRRRWDKTGWIVHRKHEDRKYLVQFEDGAKKYVNRIQLRPAQGRPTEPVLDQDSTDLEPPSTPLMPPTVPAPAPEIRRSTRAGRGHKSCRQSCAGCQKLSCPEPNIRYKTRIFRPSG